MFFICGLKNTIKNIQDEQELLKRQIKNVNEKLKTLENIMILQNNRISDMEKNNPIENIIDTVDQTISSPSILVKTMKLITKIIL
jgi:hypothetical protein